MGLWQASNGAVHFAGKDITALHTPQIAAMGVLAIDGPSFFFWSLLLVFGLGGVALFAERGLGNGQSAFASSAATVPGSPLEREADKLRREHTEIFPLMLFSV